MNFKAFAAIISLIISSSVFAGTTAAVDKPITLQKVGPSTTVDAQASATVAAKRNVAQDSTADAAKTAQCFQTPGTSQNEFIRDYATSLTFTVDQLIAVTTMCKTLENTNPGETSMFADPDALVKLRQNYSADQVGHLYGNCIEVRDCLEGVFDSHNQSMSDIAQLQQFQKALLADRKVRKTRKD